MNLKRNLFLLFALTVFASTSSVLSLYNYDPHSSSVSVFVNFYSSLFVALAGIFSIIFYFIKIKIFKTDRIYGVFWPSIRQSLFISAALVIILYLQSLRILDWLIGLSVLIVTVLLEMFFETKKLNKA